jgi:tRNA uridine 5-carboxymethylaminomethyl modification enzyme
MNFNYDIIVVGAGHAGCEAALQQPTWFENAAHHHGYEQNCQMSCNPAVGGIAKGQIVREIDALGGQMGIVSDRTAIQFRMLNRSKGPAMWSPRVQSDRMKFIATWREIIENTPNLYMWQDTVTELLLKNGSVVGVKTKMQSIYG